MQVLQESYEIIASHNDPVQTICASNDGIWLLTGDTERQIKLWKNGELHYQLDVRTTNAKAKTIDRIRSVCFSADSSQFYVASGPSLQAFRTEDGKRQWAQTLPRFLGFLFASPFSVDAASDGRFAIANDNGTFGLRDSFGRKLRLWKHNSAPRWLRFAKNETHLIGSDSFSIRLWDCETGETVKGFSTAERIYSLEASRVSPVFAARTLHAIQIYDLENSESFIQIPTATGLPLVAFSPVENVLAACGEHGVSVYQFNALNQRGISESESATPAEPGMGLAVEICSFSVPDTSVLSLGFTADGKSVIVGCSDGNVRKLNLKRT